MIPELTTHLWQSTLFAVVAGLLTAAFRRNRAQVRYWLWLSASLKFLVPFLLLVSIGNRLERVPGARKIGTQITAKLAAPAVALKMEQITKAFPGRLPQAPATRASRDWLSLAVFGLWACGSLSVALIRFRDWGRIRAAVRSSLPLDLPATVEVRSSAGLLAPGVVGWLRPILLLPAGIAERLTTLQLEAVLAHELCHVRRRDNLFASIHMFVEAMFWFHPLVWWIGARLVEERERACDEEVLRLGCEPREYAEGILSVCKLYVESPLACISGVTGSNLQKRIRAIMTERVAGDLSLAKKAGLAAAGLAALALPIAVGMMNALPVRAQSPARPPLQSAAAFAPKFEVATIKPTGSRGGGSMRPFPGRLTASAPLRVLMEAAYHVQPFQIVGGPEWVQGEGYAVDAKASSNPDVAQMMVMLQSLLADRFQLQIHRESREMPVYALVPARSGLKLPAPREGSCVEETEVLGPLANPGARMQPPGQGPAPAQRCGGLDVPLGTEGARMRGGKVPMAEFVRVLSLVLGRTVKDQTGFSGVFDVDLGFLPDDTTAGLPPPPPGAIPAGTASPSIFTAVQQLGLRLESAKGQVEVLVIDHVEKPSEN